ncbi:hypothetical protein DPEC_G00302360 [Dallia pectoralis]|uniref:Uncharacterized protein n=1 Tax=Dallia pectoralis TaxID=75939 RepID=A0ACC2FGX6_DALPE|nr:hypothetical protein DPEC_G00302360 [Dallia pectoralis]
MKRKVARLRLSPNEEAQLIREEHERRRKLRIQQVREQERYIALQIRREVQQRRERELQNLAEELKEEWETQQKEKLETLQKLFQDNLSILGEGHRSAKENEPDWIAIAQKEEVNHVRAEERYRQALKGLQSHRHKELEEQNRFIKAKKKAIQVEKKRAAKVANLPALPPNPIENIQSKKRAPVKKSDMDGFSVTHYHMPETAVDREADTEQPNACELAVKEAQRLQELGQEDQRERLERMEKARLRGNHALRREQLTQDRERLLVELDNMQQADLRRRRQVVAQMPAQIFQPLYKRQEMREDWQREMEFAFEDMYTGERRVKGDLVLQLVPEPLLALSTGSQDEDLDLSLDGNPHHLTPLAEAEQDGASTEGEELPKAPDGAPRQTLRKLLNRIRSQRDQRSSRGQGDPSPDGQTAQREEVSVAADVMTIETGSLASEEMEEPCTTTSPRPPESSQPAPETTEESIVAGTLLRPDEQALKINSFETERMRREEELERQKQEQIVLLQELEEKKCQLELLLQEAQQEKEQLKRAITQDPGPPSGSLAIPAQDHVSPPALSPKAAIPIAAEDGHSSRIRQYQQRLVEQNRLHKQSVEQGRQRLEEYQRTLRNRYSGVTTATYLPPALPQPHLHEGTMPRALEARLELPSGSALAPCLPTALTAQTPVEILTPEPSILAQTSFHAGLGTTVGFVPGHLEPTAKSLINQRAGVSAWLSDDVFDRVTRDLQERQSFPSSSLDPGSHRPPSCSSHPAPHIPPISFPLPAISPTLSQVAATPPGDASVQPGPVLRTSARMVEEMERQRQELREAQQRVEAQRVELFLQQRELEKEQRTRQRKELQELLTADKLSDAAHSLGRGSEVMGAERLRLMASLLMAIEESNGNTSAEANQSQDDSQNILMSHHDRPALQPLSHLHPRAAKPPVARARLGITDMTMEQHELSAIQEVETPVNSSLITALEEGFRGSRIEQAVPEEQESSERCPSSTPMSTAGEPSAEEVSGTETKSGTSSKLSWRDRLCLEAGASLEPELTPAVPGQSHCASEFRRGVAGQSVPQMQNLSLPSSQTPLEPDYLSSTTISSGSYVTTDPDNNSIHIDSSVLVAGFGMGGAERTSSANGLSSPRLSSCKAASGPGSPITDSLLHNSSIQRIIDKYTREFNLSLSSSEKQTGLSDGTEGSVFDGSSSSGSQPWSKVLQEKPGPDPSPVSCAHPDPLPSDTRSGAQRLDQEWDNRVNRMINRLTDESSFILDQGRESTLSPLIGRTSLQSSCLGMDQVRNSIVGRMIGQPSAQSSSLGIDLNVIGHLASQSTHSERRWDSTLARMISGPSNQLASVCQLTDQMELDHSSPWLNKGPKDSQLMRPLVGELDESAVQWNKSSGADGSNSQVWVDLGVSSQTGVLSEPQGGPEVSLSPSSPSGVDTPNSHSQSLPYTGARFHEKDRPDDSFHPLQAEFTHNETAEPAALTLHHSVEEVEVSWSSGADGSNSQVWVDPGVSSQTGVLSEPQGGPEVSLSSSSPSGLDTPSHSHYQGLQYPGSSFHEEDRPGVDPAADSFHLLQAEVTHNQTSEPSIINVHLQEQNVETYSHDEETDHYIHTGDLGLSACSEEFEDHSDTSGSSEPSPERLRGGEEPPQPQNTMQDSLYQLTRSQCLLHDSALVVSPGDAEVGMEACSLSGLSCEDTPSINIPQESGERDANEISTPTPQEAVKGAIVTFEDLGPGRTDSQLCSKSSPPIWERIKEVGSIKGIMDESILTLLSLTDNTLQEVSPTEEVEGDMKVESHHEDRVGKEMVARFSLDEDTGINERTSHAVMLLEFQSHPSVNQQEAFQQKRRCLMQRSTCRVEKIQAKRAEIRAKTHTQSDSTETKVKTTTRTQSAPTNVQSDNIKPRREGRSVSSTHARGDSQQHKQMSQEPFHPSLQVSDAGLKKVGEVKITTPESRKQDVLEMRQRTERLYSRLEEVKNQKKIRSRQQAYAENREKAKEFHKKTLQKLRAKHTLR